jgi:GT2 family glycosyltransferase
MLGYLGRNNPLKPQETDLAKSNRLAYRLKLYLGRQWKEAEYSSTREVYAFAGANMSFRRRALLEVGRFDERFRFGGEDQDLCMRLAHAFPSGRLLFVPTARVSHHFKSSVRDTLRRSRAYGRGCARLYRKWPAVPPTFFPGPLLVLTTLLLATQLPLLAGTAVAMPYLLYPKGLRSAITSRSGASLLDAFVQLAQELYGNVGFLEGLWRFRHLIPEARVESVATELREGANLVP